MKEQIEKLIKQSLKNLNIEDVSFSVEHPEDFKNGDYSTNVAFNLHSFYFKKIEKDIKEFHKETTGYEIEREELKDSYSGALIGRNVLPNNPVEIAQLLIKEINKNLLETISKVEAKNGFINFYLSREFFTENIKEILDKGDNWGKDSVLKEKKVMVEYTDPNPFKPFHIGHLMTNAIGESISRIFEFSGAKVVRANYQGDVGPHVAKAVYGLMKFGLPDESKSVSAQARYIGECYSKGSNLYDTDENIKKEIDDINIKIYDKSNSKINEIYDWGRKVTLDAFEEIYKLLGTKFDRYFFESAVAPIGEKVVRENIGKIFENSEGAIVFHAEKYDPKLHTRVFINSQGLPTYETKEIGLTMTKFKKRFFEKGLDLSIVTTAIEQAEYMKVVQKAISLMHPDLEKKMKHITHGMMKFASGKMSSRKGNIITGESLLNDSISIVIEKMKDRDMTDAEKSKIGEQVGISALKYSILKSSLGSDIIYDFDKSISFDGDSGPYLQYTAVRARSILNKTPSASSHSPLAGGDKIPDNIIDLERMLYKFEEIIEYSYIKLEPHHIAIYLTELASAFNTFYNNTQIIKDDNLYMRYHLDLVKAFYQTMKNGLWLLGIEVPEKM